MPDFKTAKVIKHDVPAATYHDLVFETPEPFDFTPGQFISLQVAENQMRAYSVAGKLSDNQFGLLIDSSPGGLGSQYAEKLQVGDEIKFIGPVGNLKFNPDCDCEQIVFLAIGCGIAPVKAMIEAALKQHNLQKPMTLYFGVRYPGDIFWDEHFNQLQKQYPNFKFKLCLSKPDESWQGLSGHITDHLKTDFSDAKNASVYMCGNQKMSDEAIEVLTTAGCPKERIFHESYG